MIWMMVGDMIGFCSIYGLICNDNELEKIVVVYLISLYNFLLEINVFGDYNVVDVYLQFQDQYCHVQYCNDQYHH
jgi:hypothetical protein